MKTRAAVLYQQNHPLVIEKLEIPRVQRGQVLIQLKASGICRSQLNEVKGYKGTDRFLPHLLGHEGAGVVVTIGSRVTKVKPNDHVVVSWIKGSGIEAKTPTYRSNKTIINAGPVATFSQYAIISENRITKISKEIPFVIAALLGCAVPTGAGIVLHTLQPKPATSLAVFGVGGIGLNALLGAVIRKCRMIIAVDINMRALRLARTLGATHAIHFDSDTAAKIIRITKGGLDYAVEASGKAEAIEAAFQSLNATGIAVIAGNVRNGEKITLNPFEFIAGKKLIGTWGGETKPDADIPFYAREYLKGKLNLDRLISKKIKLESINHALTLMEQKRSFGRMIIEFE